MLLTSEEKEEDMDQLIRELPKDKFETLVVDRVKLVVTSNYNLTGLSMSDEALAEIIGDRLAFQLSVRLLGNKVFTNNVCYREIPKTWWDHVKMELLPSWLTRWLHPIRLETIYTRIEIEHVCPHIPTLDDSHVHYAFLRPPSGRSKI